MIISKNILNIIIILIIALFIIIKVLNCNSLERYSSDFMNRRDYSHYHKNFIDEPSHHYLL